MVIVRIMAFWYKTQTMCVKWGKVNSAYFNASNEVRQGGILSGAPNSAKFRGGCSGPSKIRQRGGCNNFLLFTR